MKSKIQSLRGLLAALVAVLVCASASSSLAQGDLTFSGGEGTPISITLAQPLTYTITLDGPANPVFLFEAVGGAFGDPSMFGDITFSINGNEPQSLTVMGSTQYDAGSVYLYGATQFNLNIGDTIVLSGGMLTTDGNSDLFAPAGGQFSTFIVDQVSGSQISSNGIAAGVPEPTTWIMLVGGLGLLVCGQRFFGGKKA